MSSYKVTVFVPTLCWCNRWPDYGDFLADVDLWASPENFSHAGGAKTLQKTPPNGLRGHPMEKRGSIFGRFFGGQAPSGSILGDLTSSG